MGWTEVEGEKETIPVQWTKPLELAIYPRVLLGPKGLNAEYGGKRRTLNEAMVSTWTLG